MIAFLRGSGMRETALLFDYLNGVWLRLVSGSLKSIGVSVLIKKRFRKLKKAHT
jgi:hypothetical protein